MLLDAHRERLLKCLDDGRHIMQLELAVVFLL